MNKLEEIKERGSIILIKEDFNTLDVKSNDFIKQFTNPKDCPIARALKRLGFTNISIGVESDFRYNGVYQRLYTIGDTNEIRRVATELLDGAEFGEIFIDK